jgi:hypothetical protein
MGNLRPIKRSNLRRLLLYKGMHDIICIGRPQCAETRIAPRSRSTGGQRCQQVSTEVPPTPCRLREGGNSACRLARAGSLINLSRACISLSRLMGSNPAGVKDALHASAVQRRERSCQARPVARPSRLAAPRSGARTRPNAPAVRRVESYAPRRRAPSGSSAGWSGVRALVEICVEKGIVLRAAGNHVNVEVLCLITADSPPRHC